MYKCAYYNVYTLRQNKIRLISARKATRKEKQQYQEG